MYQLGTKPSRVVLQHYEQNKKSTVDDLNFNVNARGFLLISYRDMNAAITVHIVQLINTRNLMLERYIFQVGIDSNTIKKFIEISCYTIIRNIHYIRTNCLSGFAHQNRIISYIIFKRSHLNKSIPNNFIIGKSLNLD